MDIRKILVGSDFSDSSEKAVRWAVDLAKEREAQVLLLHVIQPPAYPPMMGGLMDPSQYEAGLRQDADRRLKEIAAKEKGVRLETRLLTGDPSVDICEVAQKEGVDLIVVGSHGRTGASRLLIGSVAERVVRHAPCAVLVVGRKVRG